MTVKAQLFLSEQAMQFVNANASERKKGEWVSNVIVDYMRLVEFGNSEGGISERVEAKIDLMLSMLSRIVENR